MKVMIKSKDSTAYTKKTQEGLDQHKLTSPEAFWGISFYFSIV